MLEEAQRTQQQFDSTTTFYRWSYGIKAIAKARKEYLQSVLAVTNIEKFSAINEKYGLVYGDLVLEMVAHLLKDECKKITNCDSIGVRGRCGSATDLGSVHYGRSDGGFDEMCERKGRTHCR